jgi:hypothetical protein
MIEILKNYVSGKDNFLLKKAGYFHSHIHRRLDSDRARVKDNNDDVYYSTFNTLLSVNEDLC